MNPTLPRLDLNSIATVLTHAGYDTGTPPNVWGPTVAKKALQAFAADVMADRLTIGDAPPIAPVITSPATVDSGVVRFQDLYHLNPFNAAALVKAGVPAVVHKASDGLTGKDNLYTARIAEGRAQGLLDGAYHFTQYGDGRLQAENFLRAIGKTLSDKLALCLDYERQDGKTGPTIKQGEDFIKTILAETGRVPIVYGGGGCLRDQLQDVLNTIFGQCPLWLAEYNPTAHSILPTWKDYLWWQYRQDSAGVDWNLWRGTLAAFRAGWPFTYAAQRPDAALAA